MGRPAELEHLVVISDQSSPVGGAEIIALRSAEVMADLGIRVTFICGDSGADCPVDRSKVTVVPLGGQAWGDEVTARASVDGLFNGDVRRALSEFVKTNDSPGTVYHLHNWTKILSPSVFVALKPVISRLFCSAHDFALACPNLSYSNYQRGGAACPLTPLSASCLATHCDRHSYLHKLWRVARSIERRVFLDFKSGRPLVGIIHPKMAEYYVRGGIPADSLRVVRNPVKPFAEERIQSELNSDLFFIGRMVQEKGVDLAAEAARQVGRRLRVIGDGPLRPELQAKYPELVCEGWRSHDEISRLIGEARGLIVSSRLPETFTLVAHEAMRAGVPVVAFSDVDCEEAALIGAAIAVPPREVSSLISGLTLLDDDARTEQISRAAFAEAHRFSNTDASWREALLGHYGELLGPAAGQALNARATVAA